MKNTKALSWAYFAFAAVCSLGLAAWRVITLLDEKGFSQGKYTSESKGAMTAFGICVFVAALACLSSYFVVEEKRIKRKKSSVKNAFSIACSFVFIIVFAYNIMNFGQLNMISLIGTFFAAATSGYFIGRVVAPSNNITKALGFSPIFWAFFMLLSSYFATDGLMTDANKILSYVALLAIMLYFSHEMRINLKIQRGRLYFIFSLICMMIIGAYALPAVIASFMGKIDFSIATVTAIAECVLYFYVAYNAYFYIVARNYNEKNAENTEKIAENA